jgi:hypothetical protein
MIRPIFSWWIEYTEVLLGEVDFMTNCAQLKNLTFLECKYFGGKNLTPL